MNCPVNRSSFVQEEVGYGTSAFAILYGRGLHNMRRTSFHPVTPVRHVGRATRNGEPIGKIPGGCGNVASRWYRESDFRVVPHPENVMSSGTGCSVRVTPTAQGNGTTSGVVETPGALVQTAHHRRNVAEASVVSRRLRFASRNRVLLDTSPDKERKTRKTMHFRKIIGAFVTAMVVCLSTMAPAQAQFKPMMDFSTPQLTPSITFTSNGGSGGTLVTNAGGTLIDIGNGPLGSSYNGNAYLTFGPISQIAGSGTQSYGILTTAQFSGGSFEIWTGANKTGVKLLGGTFGNSLFIASGGANLFSLGFGNMWYDNSSVFGAEFLSKNPGTGIIGNFALSLSSLSQFPIGVNGSGGLKSFTASGFSGTMDALAVPEPGEYAVMGMAGLTVCGLIVRARRRRSSEGLAS